MLATSLWTFDKSRMQPFEWVQIVDSVWDIGIDDGFEIRKWVMIALLIGDTNISGSYDVTTEFVLHGYDSEGGHLVPRLMAGAYIGQLRLSRSFSTLHQASIPGRYRYRLYRHRLV